MDADLIDKLQNLRDALLALVKDINALLSPPARLIAADAAQDWEEE